MITNPWVQASSFKTNLTSPVPFLYLPKKLVQVKAISANAGQNPSSSSEKKNALTLVLDIPQTIWRQTLQPLNDFGFDQRSISVSGVALFVVSGAVLLALSLVWLRLRFKKYQVVFEFPQAFGICLGTPVKIRGVTVGTVVQVDASLKSVNAVVEIEDDKVIIPRNSLVEVNRSGLLMETLIDIMPQDPLPTPSAGPLDPDCVAEGLIFCDRESIRGYQGVSLDALVRILIHLGREMEDIRVSRCYSLVETVAAVVQEAQPLLAKIEAMAEDIHPSLAEVRDSVLLKDVESLSKSLAEATENLRRLQSSIISPENSELIQHSISTLKLTLENTKRIITDISGFMGDEATRQNLKLLIKSLSRLL